MSSSNRTRIRIAKEETLGVLPGNPNWQDLRTTGDISIGREINTYESEELRSDRQVSDLVTAGFEVNGDAGFELSPNGMDSLLEGALFNSFSVPIQPIEDEDGIALVVGQDTTKITDANGGFLNTVKAGDWIQISGFARETNNGFYQVESYSRTELIMKNTPTGVVSEAAGEDISIKFPSRLTNGVQRNSYHIEQSFLANNPVDHQLSVGVFINSLKLDIAGGEAVKGTFSVLGKNASFETDAIAANSQTFTDKPFGSADVVGFNISGVNPTVKNFVPSLSIDIQNNIQSLSVIGVQGSPDLIEGTCSITVDFTSYFSSTEIAKKAINNEEFEMTFIMKSGNDYYVINMPKIKLATGGKPLIEGRDGFVTINPNGSALASDLFKYQLAIYKL